MKLKKEAVKARGKAAVLYMRQDVEWQQNMFCPGIFLLVRSVLHTHTVDICPSRKGSRL